MALLDRTPTPEEAQPLVEPSELVARWEWKGRQYATLDPLMVGEDRDPMAHVRRRCIYRMGEWPSREGRASAPSHGSPGVGHGHSPDRAPRGRGWVRLGLGGRPYHEALTLPPWLLQLNQLYQ